jgi:hypothetical protein
MPVVFPAYLHPKHCELHEFRKEVNIMALLDLQGLEAPGGHGGGGGGGSTLTALVCGSTSPSNLSVAACH